MSTQPVNQFKIGGNLYNIVADQSDINNLAFIYDSEHQAISNLVVAQNGENQDIITPRAEGFRSLVIGPNSSVKGDYSVAIGNNNTIDANNSLAIGAHLSIPAGLHGASVFGINAKLDGTGLVLAVGNGDTTTPGSALRLYSNGTAAWHATSAETEGVAANGYVSQRYIVRTDEDIIDGETTIKEHILTEIENIHTEYFDITIIYSNFNNVIIKAFGHKNQDAGFYAQIYYQDNVNFYHYYDSIWFPISVNNIGLERREEAVVSAE